MKITKHQASTNKNMYCTPECGILEIKTEGIICSSSSADKIVLGDPLTDEFFDQIF